MNSIDHIKHAALSIYLESMRNGGLTTDEAAFSAYRLMHYVDEELRRNSPDRSINPDYVFEQGGRFIVYVPEHGWVAYTSLCEHPDVKRLVDCVSLLVETQKDAVGYAPLTSGTIECLASALKPFKQESRP